MLADRQSGSREQIFITTLMSQHTALHLKPLQVLHSAGGKKGSGPELLSIEELFTTLFLEYCDFTFCFIHTNMRVFLSGLLLLVLLEVFFLSCVILGASRK